MFYIPIQKDFSKVKNKVALGLTKRQLLCFALAALAGIPSYILLKNVIATDIAGVIMIIVMLPFFLFALYEKDGQPLEEVLRNVIREKYLRPQIRPVINEPVIGSVMQVAQYMEEMDRLKKEAEEKSFKNRLFKATRRGGSIKADESGRS
ncbi:MAG: PrgI family protein [Lachnospiraceae bacterium]|nr:PrgI family protein [Lachnospiraceae bacterium]